MSKYGALCSHLAGLGTEQWRASFEEIEEVLGFRLPPSARDHPAWWANETEAQQPQKLAWLRAGWRTANLNLTGETIEFVRVRERKAMPATVQAERPDVWLDDVLRNLAARRPIFHSEADFQHALAQAIHEADPDIPIRPEYRPFPDERLYVDVWLGGDHFGRTQVGLVGSVGGIDLRAVGVPMPSRRMADPAQQSGVL